MTSIPDSFLSSCPFQTPMSPVPFDIRTEGLESTTLIPVAGRTNEVLLPSVVLPIPDSRNFPMHPDRNDDIQDLRSLPATDVPSPHLSPIATTVPLVWIDDTNGAESRNEELKLPFCHNQLHNNNNRNCDVNDQNTTTNTDDTIATTVTAIFDSSNFNNDDNIDFDSETMTTRNQIPFVKSNPFEASCSSSDIYGDSNWYVKVASTDLYQHQQQPYLNYNNTQQIESPDLISLPASLGSYDRSKTTTGNVSMVSSDDLFLKLSQIFDRNLRFSIRIRI